MASGGWAGGEAPVRPLVPQPVSGFWLQGASGPLLVGHTCASLWGPPVEGPLAPGGHCTALAREQERPRPDLDSAWGQVVSGHCQRAGGPLSPPSVPDPALQPQAPSPSQNKVKVEVAQARGRGLFFLSFSLCHNEGTQPPPGRELSDKKGEALSSPSLSAGQPGGGVGRRQPSSPLGGDFRARSLGARVAAR